MQFIRVNGRWDMLRGPECLLTLLEINIKVSSI